MKNNNGRIQKFFNEHFGSIRSFVDENETIWFVGIDIANALGYKVPKQAIVDHIKKKHKMILSINSLSKFIEVSDSLTSKNSDKGGARRLVFIDESAVYKLIAKSNLPKAEEFQDWVFEEVLPSIRKHGIYIDKDHDKIRSFGINVRLVESRAIKHLLIYAREKYDIELNRNEKYGKLSCYANKISEIAQDTRDDADSINLAICLTMEACIAVTIDTLINMNIPPFDIVNMTFHTISKFLKKLREESKKRKNRSQENITPLEVSQSMVKRYVKVTKKSIFNVLNTS